MKYSCINSKIFHLQHYNKAKTPRKFDISIVSFFECRIIYFVMECRLTRIVNTVYYME